MFIVNTDEALYLLATCYFRSGKPQRAYSVLSARGFPTPQCRYLAAQCCLQLNRWPISTFFTYLHLLKTRCQVGYNTISTLPVFHWFYNWLLVSDPATTNVFTVFTERLCAYVFISTRMYVFMFAACLLLSIFSVLWLLLRIKMFAAWPMSWRPPAADQLSSGMTQSELSHMSGTV